ncbi:MAG: L,D-transpeptidase [Clostridia bacterium]
MIILKKQNIKKTIIYIIIIAGIMSAIFLLLDRSKEAVTSVNSSKGEYEILVDVEESVLYLIQNNEIIKTYKCSGGKWSTPSPIGTWKIVGKDTWGEGFRWKMDGVKCSLGKIRNTWNIKSILTRLGKFTRMYKNE